MTVYTHPVPRLMVLDNIDQEVNNNGNYCINQPCAKHLLVSLGISTFKWKQFNKRKYLTLRPLSKYPSSFFQSHGEIHECFVRIFRQSKWYYRLWKPKWLLYIEKSWKLKTWEAIQKHFVPTINLERKMEISTLERHVNNEVTDWWPKWQLHKRRSLPRRRGCFQDAFCQADHEPRRLAKPCPLCHHHNSSF